MAADMSSLMGSYKISSTLLDKLTAGKLVLADGSTCRGVSSLELDAVIYFTTIADSSGFIEAYRTSDLAGVLGCTTRATYHIIAGLVRKAIITASNTQWAGVMDIRILDNDFSDTVTYEGVHYLNVNHSFFDPSEESFYAAYRHLSLYAKRTLLIIMNSFHGEYGCRINIDQIRDRLKIRNRRLVVSYLRELEHLLGEGFYNVEPDRRRRYRYGSVSVRKGTYILVPNAGIKDSQDSYFKRSFRTYLYHHGIISSPEAREVNPLLNKLYSTIYAFADKGHNVSVLLDTAHQTFLDLGVADEYVVKALAKRLQVRYGPARRPKQIAMPA